MMRHGVTRSAVVLLLAWGCGGSSNYFDEEPEGASGKGGTGQGGSAQGGSSGVGGTGGAGGAGGGGGTGGASGGSGGGGGTGNTGGGGGTGGSSSGAGGGAGVGQGGAAGSPAGGSAGFAGSGQGGAGAAGMACSDPDASGGRGDGSTEQSTTTGTNGPFTDSCDESGNLIEYSCELGPCISARIAVPFAGRGGYPQGGAGGVAVCPTGTVVPRTIDCGGHCAEGACFGWCAEQGGSFQITGVEASTLAMTKGAYDYTCTVAFQREGFDCLSDSLVGRTLVVTSLGACTGGSTTFGWDDPDVELLQECAFTCNLE